MSETIPSGNLEPPFSVSIDPSAEGLPSTMVGAYADMNAAIARDRTLYGLSLQASHLSASRQNITETAQEALRRTRQGDDRTAIILGAGGCLDIPLEQVVTDFDNTTVVDVHTEHTEQALSDLPPKLLGKVNLVQAELSGLAKGVSGAFERASSEREYSQFLSVATAMIRKLDVVGSQVEFSNNYAFVCSQLLMTQLCSIPFTHFSRMIDEKYGKPLTMVPGHEDEGLIRALNEQNVRTQTGHIKQLNHLARSNGTVHFADTFGEMRGGKMLPMVSYAVIETIEGHFDELREANVWNYIASLQQTFVVGSHSLVPKLAA